VLYDSTILIFQQLCAGLRVAKEDKHTNLIRGRALKAQALAQAQSETTAKVTLPDKIVRRIGIVYLHTQARQ
jgi:hypothetical protein